jgi:peptide/nickel transport system permease protein
MTLRWKTTLKQLATYKSALLGISILILLTGISIYTVVTIPYEEAVRLWRTGEDILLDNPRNAQPGWINYFSSKKQPETIILDTLKGGTGVTKITVPGERMSIVRIEYSFNYDYDDFPSEINLFFEAKFNQSRPYITLYWTKPNSQQIKLKDLIIKAADRYYISIDDKLAAELRTYLSSKIGQQIEYDIPPEIALFAVEDESILKLETAKPLKGKYKIIIEATLFERDANVDTKLVVYGKVFGLAGTDHLRRDLRIALLWGAPIAMSFGILASVSISMLQMIIAAISAWFGRLADSILQKATEFMMILPFLPILMLIAIFYKISIWVLLIVVIGLSIFGSGVKTYRAMFLQVKELPYIEAARSYGASGFRIIFRYMIPKILPTIIPSLVLSVSGFVFLEAALAILGLGDPVAPTWGKVINDAYNRGALYKGYYYWVLQPSLLLVLTALGFALLGFTLDKIFNPRLREM